jgi:YgiT-type zinc finger domain-containing protein
MIDRITVNPNIHFGKPCIAGTRITVQNVLELLKAGIGFDEVIRDYYPDLAVEDIQACLRYAIALVTTEDIHVMVTADTADDDDLRPEYSPELLHGGVRGKYAKRCRVCSSTEVRQEHVNKVFFLDGKHILVEDIPAMVCVRCGEAVFNRETTEQIRRMVHGKGEPVRTEVIDVFAYS